MRKKYTPVLDMVLISHDEDKGKTDGGIILPDFCKEFCLTGRVVEISQAVKDANYNLQYAELDRVLYNTRERIPTTTRSDCKLFLVDYRAIKCKIEEEEDGD